MLPPRASAAIRPRSWASRTRALPSTKRAYTVYLVDDTRARAAVERAEREPLLGHRVAPVRAAIAEAAPLLDESPVPELRARLLLRLAQVALAENDLEAAEQALDAVGHHAP